MVTDFLARLSRWGLSLLGFSIVVSCRVEYGSPYTTFQVSGKVTDENNVPVQNIEVSAVETMNKTVTGKDGSFAIEGTNFETNNVSVTIPIEEYTEKALSIPVEVTGVPANYKIRTFPQIVEVSCNIPISRFKELTEDMFAVEVPYAQLEENVSGTIEVQVTKKPDWVRYCHTTPTKIEFLLEQNTSFK